MLPDFRIERRFPMQTSIVWQIFGLTALQMLPKLDTW